MEFKYIGKMIVLLSFLFLNKIIVSAEISTYVKIKYENITLANLAPDLTNISKANEIIFGKIKVPGGKFLVKGNQIKSELYKLGIKNINVPDIVTVERDFIEVKTEDIEKLLIELLKIGKNDFDYSIFISDRDTLKMPLGKLEYKVTEGELDTLGKKQLKALVYENNSKVYEFPITLNTGKVIKEYMLIKDVQKGEKVNLDKIAVKKEFVYEENKIKNIDINESYVYTETLLAGTKLQEKYFEINSVIKKGQRIVIEVNYGGLKISDKGESLENGDFGKEIDIKILRTGKIVKGLVVGENRVEIKVQ